MTMAVLKMSSPHIDLINFDNLYKDVEAVCFLEFFIELVIDEGKM